MSAAAISDAAVRAVWDRLTEAQRMTLVSVRVIGVLTVWRVGAHKRTLAALRAEGILRSAIDGGGLSPLGERLQAIGLAAGYGAPVEPRSGGRVSASINGEGKR